MVFITTCKRIESLSLGIHTLVRAAMCPIIALCLFAMVGPVQAQVIWLGLNPSNQVQVANPRLYGLNIWDGLDPNVASDSNWKQLVANIGAPVLRYHAAEQVVNGTRQCWVDYNTQTWNAGVIKTSLQGISYTPNDKLITIAGWPAWMADSSGRLSQSQYSNYAAFCASLVTIINKQQGLGVKYWEVFNEKAGGNPYSGSTDMASLAQIQIQCAAAMKQVDPSIKIVAGAWANPYDSDINTFLSDLHGSPQAIDVWSHHQYGGGSGFANDQAMYAAAPNIASGAAYVRNELNSHGFTTVPLWVDEYNIFWSVNDDTGGYMAGIQGGVFAALTIASCIQGNQTDALMLWQDSGYLGSRYGAIDYSWSLWDYDKLNPSGQVLSLFRSLCTGRVVSSTYSDTTKVTSVAFVNGSNVTWVLINQSASPQTVYWQGSVNWSSEQCLTSTGLTTASPSLYYGTLPAESVEFFTGHM